MNDRAFWSLTLALLALMVMVQIVSALEENQSFDEAYTSWQDIPISGREIPAESGAGHRPA